MGRLRNLPRSLATTPFSGAHALLKNWVLLVLLLVVVLMLMLSGGCGERHRLMLLHAGGQK